MRATLEDLAHRIEDSSIEGLVTNAGSIRSRFTDIRSELPEEVSAALHPVAFMEYRFPDFRRAQQNLERRAEQRRLASAADALVARSEEEAAKVERLQSALDAQTGQLATINQEIADLKSALALKEKEAAALSASISKLSAEVTQQESVLANVAQAAQRAAESAPRDIGSDDEDLRVLADLQSLITRAAAAVRDLLSRTVALE